MKRNFEKRLIAYLNAKAFFKYIQPLKTYKQEIGYMSPFPFPPPQTYCSSTEFKLFLYYNKDIMNKQSHDFHEKFRWIKQETVICLPSHPPQKKNK